VRRAATACVTAAASAALVALAALAALALGGGAAATRPMANVASTRKAAIARRARWEEV
jgi:hypothetical protein